MIEEAKNIYCLGIGGIGVSGLARLFKAMGKNVWGSDIKESEITKGLAEVGIKVLIGHDLKNLEPRPDLVIYSLDVSPEASGFVELQQIDQWGINKLTQAEAIGRLMEDKFGVAVTGTNGKSTTTSLLGLMLEQANFDPTVLVGSMLAPENQSEKFKANARLGDSKYFVVESDEYHKKMLQNKPRTIVVTNIAEDHLDFYKDLADIKAAFLEYFKSLPEEKGMLVYNADDKNTVDVCKHNFPGKKYTFGIHHYADLQAVNIKTVFGEQTFDLHLNDQMIGNVSLKVPGLYNVSNALAAALTAFKLGVEFEQVKQALDGFAGIWRRFEIVGALDGKEIISDYAHHPIGVEQTILAAKEFYKGKKILTVFQPHHRNRTQALFGQFVESLVPADELIVSEIFDVPGREHGEQVSSKQLVEELKRKGVNATYAKDLSETESLIREKIKNYDKVLMMGAGDIDTLARKLVQ